MSAASRKALVNLCALASIQVSNALVPLLIVPFALTMIGAAAYAELAIAEAVSVIVLATVLFSFEVDGVAGVVGLRGGAHRTQLSDAVSAIVAARFLLLIVASASVLTIYVLATDHSPLILALWLLVPLGHVFHSYWFYQGIEANLPAAAITLCARLISLVVIFVGVDGPDDQFIIPLAVGGPFAVAGLISLAYISFAYRLRLTWPGFAAIWNLLRRGKEIFAGNAAVVLYRELNVVLLGIAGVAAGGIAAYSLAEKAVKMLQASSRPLNQLFFPKVLLLVRGADSPSPKIARSIAQYTVPQLAAVLALLAGIAAAYAVVSPRWPWLADLGKTPRLLTMLAIMAPATLLGIANFMFGVAGLNYLNGRVYLLRSILLTGVVSAIFCLLLAMAVGAVGAAICFTGAEAFLLLQVIRAYASKKRLGEASGV